MAGRSRRIVWTEFAKDGLDSTLEYIGEDSPDAASRFLDVVLDTAESLSFFQSGVESFLNFNGRILEKYSSTDIE